MDNQGLEHITEIEIKLQKAESAIYYLKEEIKAYEIAVLHVKTLMPETYAQLENSSFFHLIHYREPLKYYKEEQERSRKQEEAEAQARYDQYLLEKYDLDKSIPKNKTN